MKTIIFKPAVLLMMILATAFLSFNAEQSVGHGTLKIELAPGFTIEDIIQDLHDNAFVVTTGPAQGNSIYVLHFNMVMRHLSAVRLHSRELSINAQSN